MPDVDLAPPAARRLARLQNLGYFLDNSIRLPVIGYRIGYDAILGLLPGAGDVLGLLLASYIVVEGARFRISRKTLLRMLVNVGLEALIGTIPLLGDVFDATWKANARNIRLLERDLAEPRAGDRSNTRFFLALLGVIVLFVGLSLLVFVAIVLAVRALAGG